MVTVKNILRWVNRSYVSILHSLHMFFYVFVTNIVKPSWALQFSDVSESFSAHCCIDWPDLSLIIGLELLLSGEVPGTEHRQGAELHEVINKWVKINKNTQCRLWRHSHPSAFQRVCRTCSRLSRGVLILLAAGTPWTPSWMIYNVCSYQKH